MPNPPRACWELTDHRATLRAGEACGAVDLATPGEGVAGVSLDARPLVDQMLSVALPTNVTAELVEAYVRGNDLVATYRDSSREVFRWQTYWSVLTELPVETLAAVELQLSVQTSLLASDPGLAVRSRFRSRGLWCLAGGADGALMPLSLSRVASAAVRVPEGARGCFVARLDDDVSYVEVVFERDYLSSQVQVRFTDASAFDLELSHALFRQELEKGVILRARVVGALVPAHSELVAARELDRWLSASALPLTA